MDFTEVVAEVVAVTKRPDKVAEARQQVNAALNFFCCEANFLRDLVETSEAISSSVYSQSLSLSLFARFRKVCWMRVEDTDCFLDPLDITAVKKNKNDWGNRFYVAGNLLIFQTKVLGSAMEIGYFTYPPTLTDASPDFWLLEASPYMIIDKAAAKIFASIGDDASARMKEADARVAFLSAKEDFGYGFNRGR